MNSNISLTHWIARSIADLTPITDLTPIRVWFSGSGYQKNGPYVLSPNLPVIAGAAILQDAQGTVAIADVTDGIFDISDANVSANGTKLQYGFPVQFTVAIVTHDASFRGGGYNY
jgi:hypothetical protein